MDGLGLIIGGIRGKKFVAVLLLCALVLLARPSEALAPLAILNPATLGVVVVAGGVISGTMLHYAPAIYEAGHMAIDNAAKITRTLYQVEKFTVSSGAQYLIGRAEQVTIDLMNFGNGALQWIKDHASDFPLFKSAVDAASSTGVPPPVAGDINSGIQPGDVVTVIQVSSNQYQEKIDAGYLTLLRSSQPASYGVTACADWSIRRTGQYFTDKSNYFLYRIDLGKTDCPGNYTRLGNFQFLSYPTNLPPTYIPTFVAAELDDQLVLDNQADVVEEVDKIIQALPSAVKDSPPWTAGDTAVALDMIDLSVLEKQKSDLEAAKAADPSNPGLYDPAIIEVNAKLDALNPVSENDVPGVSLPTEITPLVHAPADLPEIETSPLSSFDFVGPIQEAMYTLSSDLQTREPFASLVKLPDFLAPFVAPPVAPVFDLELPYVGQFHVDLASWDMVAEFGRVGFSILAMVGTVLFVVKVWV